MSATSPSSAPQLPPFRMEPRFDTRVWGFQDLRPWYDRVAGDAPIGEVWLTGDDSVVATGPHAGQRLGDLFLEAHPSLLGPAAPSSASPLLIKVLFAREKLSVQVHPDDRMAQKYGEPRGKTECWYCLAAEPHAAVALGLKPGVTLSQVEEQIQSGSLESSLNVVRVVAGDMIFVDAGTVHAIWPGAILLETQQNSDITYRMFDYGRPRELHVERSLEATRLVTQAGKVAPKELADRTVLIDADYFRVERIPISASRSGESLRNPAETAPSLAWLFAADGSAIIAGNSFEPIDLPPRAIVGIPALAPEFTIENVDGLDLIRITPNWPVPRA
ncbi:MAG TPA: type I phosphomannose isomerase catalytic subunit [Terracidiphilus sp.]